MGKTTKEENIIMLNSIRELTDFIKENDGKIINVQIEVCRDKKCEQRGDGSG